MDSSDKHRAPAPRANADDARGTAREESCAPAFALALLTAWAFLPAIHTGFLYLDDPHNITGNPFIQQGLGLDSLRWAFTTFRGQIWNPLLWLSYMADFRLYGLEPRGFHLTSLLLHAAGVACLFEALRRLTGRLWESALAAALWGLHPMRVESVAWLSQRYDLLFGLFSLLALAIYAGYGRRPTWTRYSALLGACALALLSKGLAVTLPVLLLVLDYWPLGRLTCKTAPALVREKLPLFAMAAATSALVIAARDPLLSSGPASPFWTRLSGVPAYYMTYLADLLRPGALPVCHQSWIPLSIGLRLGTAAGFTALSWALWRARAAAPYLWAGWLWFLVALLPVIGLAFPSGMAPRYAYMASVGLAVAISWGAAELAKRLRVKPPSAWSLGAAVLLAGCILTRRELSYWTDQRVLLERWLLMSPDNRLLHNILGVCLAQRGEHPAAESHLRESVRLDPEYADAHNNLGLLLARQGRTSEAAAEYKQALAFDPTHELARRNLQRLTIPPARR